MVASKSLAAFFILTLAAGAVHAQTAPTCGEGSRAVVPDAIAYADWGDRTFIGAATHKAFVVIRKAAPIDSGTTPRAVAYGVDVGNQVVLFQITFASFEELSAFQARVGANLLFLNQLNLGHHQRREQAAAASPGRADRHPLSRVPRRAAGRARHHLLHHPESRAGRAVGYLVNNC